MAPRCRCTTRTRTRTPSSCTTTAGTPRTTWSRCTRGATATLRAPSPFDPDELLKELHNGEFGADLIAWSPPTRMTDHLHNCVSLERTYADAARQFWSTWK